MAVGAGGWQAVAVGAGDTEHAEDGRAAQAKGGGQGIDGGATLAEGSDLAVTEGVDCLAGAPIVTAARERTLEAAPRDTLTAARPVMTAVGAGL